MALAIILQKINLESARIQIFCGSSGGKALQFGKVVFDHLKASRDEEIVLHNMGDVDPEDALTSLTSTDASVAIFVLSTYTGGQPPESAKQFFNWIEDMANDFR